MADSITEAVLGGVAPFPRNAPKKVTFEFEPGHEIVLKGHALTVWWAEYARLYVFMQQATSGPPAMSSNMIHDMFAEKTKKETADNNKE